MEAPIIFTEIFKEFTRKYRLEGLLLFCALIIVSGVLIELIEMPEAYKIPITICATVALDAFTLLIIPNAEFWKNEKIILSDHTTEKKLKEELNSMKIPFAENTSKKEKAELLYKGKLKRERKKLILRISFLSVAIITTFFFVRENMDPGEEIVHEFYHTVNKALENRDNLDTAKANESFEHVWDMLDTRKQRNIISGVRRNLASKNDSIQVLKLGYFNAKTNRILNLYRKNADDAENICEYIALIEVSEYKIANPFPKEEDIDLETDSFLIITNLRRGLKQYCIYPLQSNDPAVVNENLERSIVDSLRFSTDRHKYDLRYKNILGVIITAFNLKPKDAWTIKSLPVEKVRVVRSFQCNLAMKTILPQSLTYPISLE